MNPQLFGTVPSYAQCAYSTKEHSSKKKKILSKLVTNIFLICKKREKNGQLTVVCAFLTKYLVLVVSKTERET